MENEGIKNVLHSRKASCGLAHVVREVGDMGKIRIGQRNRST